MAEQESSSTRHELVLAGASIADILDQTGGKQDGCKRAKALIPANWLSAEDSARCLLFPLEWFMLLLLAATQPLQASQLVDSRQPVFSAPALASVRSPPTVPFQSQAFRLLSAFFRSGETYRVYCQNGIL